MLVKEGRWGPYVTDGETNASLRLGDTPESLDADRGSELLAERRSKLGTTPTKPSAKKNAPAKGGPAKSGAKKKAPAKSGAKKKAPATKGGAKKKTPKAKSGAKKKPAPSTKDS